MVRFLFVALTFVFYLSVKIYSSFFSNYKSYIVIPIVMVVASLPFILNIVNRMEIISVPQAVVDAMYFMLAVYIYFILISLVFDIMWVARIRISFIHGSTLYLGLATVVLSFAIAIIGYLHHDKTYTVTYNVTTDKPMKQDLRMVAVSDIHIGSSLPLARLNEAIETINGLEPDVVVLLGDIVDNDIKQFTPDFQAAFREIKAPVYAVFGNHEYYSGTIQQVYDAFNGAGFITLKDEVTYLDDYGVYLVGRDTITHSPLSSKKPILDVAGDLDKGEPIVILDHIPAGTDEGKLINADIQLSGHTHKGQFFPVNLIVDMMYPNAYGLLQDGNFNMIVSSGFGLWGPPVRVATNSEILLVNLKSSK